MAVTLTAPVEWTDPATVAEAIASLGPGALAKAGGVDVLDRLKERLDEPSRIVNLRQLPDLDRVSEDAERVEIGPLVTLARLSSDPRIRARLPALADAAAVAATPNVRNVATLGGNLLQRPRCWYFRQSAFPCLRKGGATCFAVGGRNAYHAIFENASCAAVHASDTAAPLVAYGARVRVAGPAGAREVPLEELLVRTGEDVAREHRLGPGELVVGVLVPIPSPDTGAAYLRQGERDSSDWPLASVAVTVEVEGGSCRRASVVLGAAAVVPWRARAAEGVLAGKRIDEQVAAAAGKAALEGATPLAENGYKLPLLEALVRRAVSKAAGGA